MSLSIRDDRVSGASALGRRCLDHLLECLRQQVSGSQEQLFGELLTAGKGLIEAQPVMASVFNRVNFVLGTAKDAFAQADSVERARELITRRIQQYHETLEATREKIAETGSELIPDQGTIMTYSASGMVEAILVHARQSDKTFAVIIPESRPMFEGTQMALRLCQQKIGCTLIADAAISKSIARADVVLIGADRLTEDTLVNKLGTLGLVLVAKAFSVPVYAAFETDKLLPKSYLPVVDRREDPAQICQVTNPYLTVQNTYFEEIGLGLLSGFITELGRLNLSQLENVSDRVSVVPELAGFSSYQLKGENQC